MNHLQHVFLAMLCCVVMPLARAAHPLVTDDAGTQGKGGQQLELNTDWQRRESDTGHIASFTYTYGLDDTLDGFVSMPFALSSPAGINDVSLGLKWRFLEKGPLSVGFKPELLLPTGDENRGLGNGRAGMALTLIGSYDADPWQWHGNLGVTFNRYRRQVDSDANRNAVWRASSALSFAISEQWKWLTDVGVARDASVDRDAYPLYLLFGIVHSPRTNIDLDAGLKFNRNCGACSSGTRQLGVGLTWRF